MTTEPAPPPEDQLLTTDQLAALLQVEPATVVKWRGAGKGPAAIRLGHNRVRYSRKDVDAWLQERRHQAASATMANALADIATAVRGAAQ